MSQSYFHQPVLREEVIRYLQVKANGSYLDATVGGGGHAEAILENNGPEGKLLGCDVDPRAVAASSERLKRFGNRQTVIRAGYETLGTFIANFENFAPFDGIVIDLGLSSDQLEGAGRGFSFKETGTADMRFDPDTALSASAILLNSAEEDLEKIFREFGEVREARRLARRIVTWRQQRHQNRVGKVIETIAVPELVHLIESVVRRKPGAVHPATKVFQALRLAVNRELDKIDLFLPQAVSRLKPTGRLVVISYHSLEDRIVKNFLKREARDCLCPPELPVCRCQHRASVRVVTKTAVIPGEAEIKNNPRSRSAKLRAAEKIT